MTCGILSNVLLVYATYKTWKQKKTPDKICILNFALSNILVCIVGLPLRLVLLVYYGDTLMCDTVRNVQGLEDSCWAMCLLVSMSTFAVIAFDRFEVLTKFPHQRKLDVNKSVIVIGVLWSICFVVAAIFYTTFPSQCRLEAAKRTPDKRRGAPRIIKQAVMVFLVGLSCERCARYLILAAKTIRQQREQINNTLGHRLADVEVTFTKNVIAFCLGNVIFAAPLVVTSVVVGVAHDVNLRCPAQWIATSVYLGFANAPMIYFSVDRRMRNQLRPTKIQIRETDCRKHNASQTAFAMTGTNDESNQRNPK